MISIRRWGLVITVVLIVVFTIILFWVSRDAISEAGANNIQNDREFINVPDDAQAQSIKQSNVIAPAYGKKLGFEYDTWSSDGALDFLNKYNNHLNYNKQPMTADPNNISTITEWWQAAAMYSWYLHSELRYKCKQPLTWFLGSKPISYGGSWAICQDEPYTVKAPCLVYSFGIAYDFSFDDHLGNLGCDVRSFDPSMTKVEDHQRSPNVHFYKYGLGGVNTDSFKPQLDEYVEGFQVWKMRTLQALTKELGHEGRTIDILKMDIETSEWPTLVNLIETDMLKFIRHLLVEYHFLGNRPPKEEYVQYFRALTRLRQLGFREYYSLPHQPILKPDSFRHLGEVYYVNINFKKTS